MFARHRFDAASIPATPDLSGAAVTLSAGAFVETARGWTRASDVRAGDRIASLDGGFVPLAWIRRAPATRCSLVPAGALGNCTDLALPADAFVGLDAPEHLGADSTDILSAPLRALMGPPRVGADVNQTAACLTFGV